MGRRTAAQTKRLIARNIRRMRQDKSWSQHDLANEAGVRQALISSLEIAAANPTLESLDKVAGALNVRLAELLSEGE
jgi:transcriptional regulator with XRE-family HTH domain